MRRNERLRGILRVAVTSGGKHPAGGVFNTARWYNQLYCYCYFSVLPVRRIAMKLMLMLN